MSSRGARPSDWDGGGPCAGPGGSCATVLVATWRRLSQAAPLSMALGSTRVLLLVTVTVAVQQITPQTSGVNASSHLLSLAVSAGCEFRKGFAKRPCLGVAPAAVVRWLELGHGGLQQLELAGHLFLSFGVSPVPLQEGLWGFLTSWPAHGPLHRCSREQSGRCVTFYNSALMATRRHFHPVYWLQVTYKPV